jgi:hypothetical protein
MHKPSAITAASRFIRFLAMTALLAALFMVLNPQSSSAGSATWNLNATGAWTMAANWTPVTVPDGPSDIATFGVSNAIEVFIFSEGFDFQIELKAIDFETGASSFSFFVDTGLELLIDGTGIKNDSGVLQSFSSEVESPIIFTNGATAGANTAFTNAGRASEQPAGTTSFSDTTSAGNATFNNEAAFAGDNSGKTNFFDSASADHGTFNNLGARSSSGATIFYDTSDASRGTFNNLAQA